MTHNRFVRRRDFDAPRDWTSEVPTAFTVTRDEFSARRSLTPDEIDAHLQAREAEQPE